jgi:two-component system sensor histidine kinase KdpD
MLRKAARIADRMGAPWYALYVQTPQESMEKIDAATQRELGKNLDMARQLGGTILQGKGRDLVSTIDAFVKEYGVTHIVLGRSRQPWYRRWFGRSIIDRLQQTVDGVDMTVLGSKTPGP